MTMRDEFEAWCGGFYMSKNNTPGSDPDGYQDPHTNGRWRAWQAATERAAKTLDDAADALMPPGKRGNAVDRHCADVLRGRAAAIRGGERAA